MNEKEIEWANGLYQKQERFNEIATEIYEDFKPLISDALHYLWEYLDAGGVTNEALRYAVRSEAISSLGAHLEYKLSIYADRLRDTHTSTPKARNQK